MCSPRTVAAGNCPKANALKKLEVQKAQERAKAFKHERKEIIIEGVRYFKDETLEVKENDT